VNNGAFRAYYLPDFPDTGLIRTVDPAMSLDSTFKVKLFLDHFAGEQLFLLSGSSGI
jgi:hypothetical protein